MPCVEYLPSKQQPPKILPYMGGSIYISIITVKQSTNHHKFTIFIGGSNYGWFMVVYWDIDKDRLAMGHPWALGSPGRKSSVREGSYLAALEVCFYHGP
jgi:hypothetical protein